MKKVLYALDQAYFQSDCQNNNEDTDQSSSRAIWSEVFILPFMPLVFNILDLLLFCW